MSLPTIGFIGLGTMGAPMAHNLVKASFDVRVYDVLPQAVARLVDVGATAAASAAAAAAGVDVIVTMLPNGDHVEEALFGSQGAASRLLRGALVIEMSTIAPATTDRLAAQLATQGITMVDAPVGRSSQHAIDGKLLIMAGGAQSDVIRAMPILQQLGDTIVHCGPTGTGARMKLVNNFMSITMNATTSEALSLAEASGLDPELARSVMLGTVAGQGHLSTTYPAKVLRGDVTPGFAIALAHKDLGLALDLGTATGVELTTGQAAQRTYERAMQAGLAREDWTAIYALARRELARQAV